MLHLPIAERYLLLSVGLLTFTRSGCCGRSPSPSPSRWSGPRAGARSRRCSASTTAAPTTTLSAEHWGHLDHQADLGPVARLAGRILPAPLAVALLGVVVLLGAAVVAWRTQQPWLAVALVAVGVLLVGAGAHPPLRSPLAWQLPTFLWAAEAVLVIGLLVATPASSAGPVSPTSPPCAGTVYDVVYRLRDTGSTRERVGHRW